MKRGKYDAIINEWCRGGTDNQENRRKGRGEIFLEKLGFVVGGEVTVISEIAGNMIVNVKDSRVAIGKDMANRIMV